MRAEEREDRNNISGRNSIVNRMVLRATQFAALAFLIPAISCTTTPDKDTVTPASTAKADVGKKSAKRRGPSTTDLLRSAEKEFNLANDKHETGEHKQALLHYTKMLEFLIEADLDPRLYYSVRGELGRILDSSSHFASMLDEDTIDQRRMAAGMPTVAGDLPMPWPIPSQVLDELDEIQETYPRGFQRGLNRSFKYAPYIRRALNDAGLPEDLMWLAMVESQFTPKIKSPAGAGGMWQFMPATARRFNLRMDSYVDERYDWQKSTHAAIEYLTDLNAMFDGNWPIAICSYNAGEGGMGRVVAANGGERDIWRLLDNPSPTKKMYRETQKYYPKLLASVIAAGSPERYGFDIKPELPDDTVRVPITGSYSLTSMDNAAKLPRGTLARLNQDLIRGVTPPSGTHKLAVPTEARDALLKSLKNLRQERARSSASGGTHTVRRGETLSTIARKYRGVSVKDIQRANKLRSPHSIRVGRKLVIPGYESSTSAGSSSSSSTRGAERTHVVKAGENPGSIASRYNIQLSRLLAWNNLNANSTIYVGQKLTVYSDSTGGSVAKATSTKNTAPQKTSHKVATGDSAWKLANKHGVTLDQLRTWNGWSKNPRLKIGQSYVVMSGGGAPVASSSSTPTATPQAIAYTVKSGDVLGKIAQDHGVTMADLRKWNKWSKNPTIHPGDTITIHPKGSGSSGPQKITHVVKKGEYPGKIAQHYGVSVTQLGKWNDWGKKPVVQIGEKLTVYK
jgi:membrane-bound lytic murein transglycosylase D